MNEKGLLFLEQPDQDFDTILCDAVQGIKLEHIEDILLIIKEIHNPQALAI